MSEPHEERAQYVCVGCLKPWAGKAGPQKECAHGCGSILMVWANHPLRIAYRGQR